MQRWRVAMSDALYGSSGFFTAGPGPAAHFRTSTNAAPLLARALARLLARLDTELGHPDRLDVVDVGAGRGELLRALATAVPDRMNDRLRLTAVERAARPDDLPRGIGWTGEIPAHLTGLLVAAEWLDDVPLDVAECDDDGTARLVLVDPATGAEAPGPPLAGRDADWLRSWWPLDVPGSRAEIGWPRDDAWASAVACVDRGLALAIDYGHRSGHRPATGTLTGYRSGRQVPPVPDGSCDLTAHVAWDPLVPPGARLVRQREALHALDVSGARPPLSLATDDPPGYLRALAAASQAAELTDRAGLGAHQWLYQPVGVEPDRLPIPPTDAGPGDDPGSVRTVRSPGCRD